MLGARFEIRGGDETLKANKFGAGEKEGRDVSLTVGVTDLVGVGEGVCVGEPLGVVEAVAPRESAGVPVCEGVGDCEAPFEGVVEGVADGGGGMKRRKGFE